jgi:dipeptidyl aminopeptidase/acylaminoacyl peptidase
MTDLTPFELRLGERLARELDRADLPFDADRIATAAMVQRRPLDRVLDRLALGPLPMATARKAALVAVAALLAVATLVVAFGVIRRDDQLAIVRMNGDVVMASADGSNQRVVGRVLPSPLWLQIAWAPGRQHLAVVGDDLQVSIIDRAGRVTHTFKLEDGFSRFAWSPDGERLAVFDGAWLPNAGPLVHPRLDVMAPDGRMDWSLQLPADFRYESRLGHVAWSPDGKSIALTGFRFEGPRNQQPYSLWIVDVDSRAVRELSSEELEASDHYPAWLPDGRLLASRRNTGIVSVDPATGAASTIVALPAGQAGLISDFKPSPDGSRLAFIDPLNGLAMLDLATGSLTHTQLPVGSASPLGWMPDGAALTMRLGEVTGDPFFPTELAALEIETGMLTILASDVLAYNIEK